MYPATWQNQGSMRWPEASVREVWARELSIQLSLHAFRAAVV